MELSQAIIECEERNISIILVDLEFIEWNGPKCEMTPDIMDALVRNKAELIGFLHPNMGMRC